MTSIFSSAESEKRWLLTMEKNLALNYVVDMPFCVFRVPRTLTEPKPEAYAPHQLGLGPLHHLRPDLYAMHKYKLAAVAKFLPMEKLHTFRLVVDALVRSEPLIRACYDQYLDLDIETLALILAMDGLCLLHFLNNYPETKHLAADVLMLENQIPLLVLEKIFHVLQLTPAADGRSLFRDFQAFFDDQSPLELNVVIECPNCAHLLERMHFLIVSNRGFKLLPQAGMNRMQLNDVIQSVGFLADRGLPGAGTAGQILSFVSEIPWGEILGMFKKDEQDSSTSADEIEIPSVSQMAEIVGIRFVRTSGGIRDVRFDDDGAADKKFYLPSIRITATTDIVLRNLVAYEAAAAQPGATLEMAEYVDLMCGIIDSRKDVEILRKAGIVESELEDEEIARIFNGIGKSEKKTERRSNVEDAVDGVNARYDSLKHVKVRKLAEKYGYGCFKVLSVVIAIVVLLLLTLQAFCSVFGCSRWFSKINSEHSDG